MTAPAEKPHAGEKHSGGLAQVVRWLTEERPITGDDIGLTAGAPRRVARWTYGDPPARPPKPDVEVETLAEVRIGPAPRCAVAGETIALSVSLVNSRGGIYLGWPIKLEWTSSDPSIATVNDFGIVDIHERGRVELTCTCEGKSGSVLLTVVEPAVAAAVGLPVPARLRSVPPPSTAFPSPFAPPPSTAVERVVERVVEREPATIADQSAADERADPMPSTVDDTPAVLEARAAVGDLEPAAAERETASSAETITRDAASRVDNMVTSVAASPIAVPIADVPAVYRRSIERGSVRRGLLASLPISRGTRRVIFRIAVGAATAAIVAIVLTRSPEEVFVASLDSAEAPTEQSPAAVVRGASTGGLATASVPTLVTPAPASLPIGDTATGRPLADDTRRVVSEAAGAAALQPRLVDAPKPATAPAASTPTPQPATSQAVARVVVASSPSQLIEGETVRLAAEGVDEGGASVSRAVTWKSENEAVAIVDPDGVVTARRPGTVTIVATSEGRTGRVTLSVGARRPEPAPAPALGRVAAAQVMSARVDEFVTALRERNGQRIASLYSAASPDDRKNLQALLERLRRPEARLKASDPVLGALEVREMEATVDFQVAMSWMTSFGRVRNQTSMFRAVLEPGDGGWRLVAIRSLGKVD